MKLRFSEIKNRLSKKFKQWNDQDNTPTDKSTNNNENKINKFFTIPLYITFIGEIKNFFKKDSLIHMAYKGINNLRGFIRGQKDVRSK